MSSGAGSSPTVTVFSGVFTVTMSDSSSSSSSSPSPSATNIQQTGDRQNGQSSSFYRNLFYILIGLLVAFGLVSFLSLLRARRRRNAIVREARRLGVMVPGIPGYISMRDRANMQWTKADGSQNPDWWEVEGKRDGKDEKVVNAGSGSGQGDTDADDAELYPLAIIPHATETPPSQTPLPQSSLPFFPNHLAYRATALQAPPARFNVYQPESIDQLYGEDVDIVTVIRMPTREPQREVEEGEEVLREWGGVELGIARMEVVDRNQRSFER